MSKNTTHFVALCLGILSFGNAIAAESPLKSIQNPAFSIHHSPSELVVAVSPTRQSLQLFGSAGLVVGTSVSAVVDDKYRLRIQEALGSYDPGAYFEGHLLAQLKEFSGADLARVSPQVGMGRHHSVGEARRARYADLGEAGHGGVLDLTLTYGIFGPQGLLITRVEGKLYALPGGKEIWGNTIVCSPLPVLADDPSGDPSSRFSPQISGLSVNDVELEKWLAEGGAFLKSRFEQAVAGVVSALLCDLELSQNADGLYYLGKAALSDKNYALAKNLFEKAISLDGENLDYACAYAVAVAEVDSVEAGVELAKTLLQRSPGYGPAHYNLAWWYATELKDASRSGEHYEKALALGMPPSKKIEKFIRKNG